MKKILVPTDFSEHARNALEATCYLAKEKNMGIKILHVLQEPYTPRFSVTGDIMYEDETHRAYIMQLLEIKKKEMERLASYAGTLGVSAVEQMVKVNKVYKGILEEITENNIDLVVMGHAGESDLQDFFMGSTTEKIIRMSKVPVLTIKGKLRDFKIRNIVFASDFEEDVRDIIQSVLRFAEFFGARMHFVRINSPSKFIGTSELRTRLQQIKDEFRLHDHVINIYLDENEEEGIINFASEVNADIIALGTHGRTGVARFFKGSIAEDLADHSFRPVLTYNIAKRKEKGERVKGKSRPTSGVNEKLKIKNEK